MGGTRSYGPILLVHELDFTFLKICPETKFYYPSSKITQVIAVADRQTDRQTDGHRSNVFFCDSMQLCKRYL